MKKRARVRIGRRTFERIPQSELRKPTLKIARHEAAHALIGEFFEARVISLRLYGRYPHQLKIGETSPIEGRVSFRSDRKTSKFQEAVIDAAGNCAEIIFGHTTLEKQIEEQEKGLTSNDDDKIARAFKDPRDGVIVMAAAMYFVRRQAPYIDAVARELLRRRVLDRAGLRRVVARVAKKLGK